VNFGNVLLKNGLPEKAIWEYKMAIEKDSRYFGAYIGLGGAYLTLKKWDEARAAFNEAVSIQPDSSIAHTNLGLALMNMKLFDKAIAEFKIAIQMWPDNEIARQNLSLAYEQSGLHEDAGKESEFAGRLKQQTSIQDIRGHGNMQK
jgi:tetratricopeptide (TPR) repeat protein